MNSPVVDFSERRGMDKQKALESALAQIERSFGKGSIMRLGSTPALDIEAISTGSIGLDVALGIGGLPKGRIIEIYGPESSGKTTLASQRSSGTAASAPSSTPSTRSTRSIRKSSASISTSS